VSDRRPLVALALAFAACATTPATPPAERWRADLDAYRAHRERLAADLRQVLDDFQALRAEPSFPGLEDTRRSRRAFGRGRRPTTSRRSPGGSGRSRYPVGRVELLSCRGPVTP